MNIYRKTVLSLFLFYMLLLVPVQTYAATSFSLVAPGGTLERGQNVDFTITIDTQGESLSSTQIGFTYDTQYLEYVSVTPGNTFTTITTTPLEAGKLLITGTNSTAYSGTGTFATVTLKIIAASAGATELCVLFAPTSQPTPTNLPVNPTAAPTAVPRTGFSLPADLARFGGLGILFLGIGLIAVKQLVRKRV